MTRDGEECFKVSEGLLMGHSTALRKFVRCYETVIEKWYQDLARGELLFAGALTAGNGTKTLHEEKLSLRVP